jgi:glycerol-3-phosphate dehydrogenase
LASDQPVDLLIVGGGVNGTGIARDAADRGLKVLLCEQDDLAQHTSSASSKLIHGGLRYLEHYEFRLVREALIEREVLLRLAPHIIWPLRFVLPHSPEQRPAWLIRIGLFLYDHLGALDGVESAAVVDGRTAITARNAESVVRELMAIDHDLTDLTVSTARLEEVLLSMTHIEGVAA